MMKTLDCLYSVFWTCKRGLKFVISTLSLARDTISKPNLAPNTFNRAVLNKKWLEMCVV